MFAENDGIFGVQNFSVASVVEGLFIIMLGCFEVVQASFGGGKAPVRLVAGRVYKSRLVEALDGGPDIASFEKGPSDSHHMVKGFFFLAFCQG